MAEMKIPFLDLGKQYEAIATEIEDAIARVIRDKAFIRGKYVLTFEKQFADYCKAKHCVGVGNGTDALIIALKMLDLCKGDEVIVPANSFIATSEAVTHAGGNVIFADCLPDTYNIDPEQIEKKISKRTKAIIPVHLYGQPADMETVKKIAEKHHLKIIQDCAQAHGATIGDKEVISYGDMMCFSFYPGKNLGAYGDAGAIVTNDNEIATKALMYSNHGRISKYDHEFEGINSRMDGMQGAILSVKLPYLNTWIEKRRRWAHLYDELLMDVPEIITPRIFDDAKHVYHLYVIRSKRRNELKDYLSKKGIATGIHYPVALPNLHAYQHLKCSKDCFPIANQYEDEILSLPIYPEMTEDMIAYVVNKIKEFHRK